MLGISVHDSGPLLWSFPHNQDSYNLCLHGDKQGNDHWLDVSKLTDEESTDFLIRYLLELSADWLYNTFQKFIELAGMSNIISREIQQD